MPQDLCDLLRNHPTILLFSCGRRFTAELTVACPCLRFIYLRQSAFICGWFSIRVCSCPFALPFLCFLCLFAAILFDLSAVGFVFVPIRGQPAWLFCL